MVVQGHAISAKGEDMHRVSHHVRKFFIPVFQAVIDEILDVNDTRTFRDLCPSRYLCWKLCWSKLC